MFGATVYETVRPMLSDRRRVLSVFSVTFVYCGQTVGRIKMKLGLRVGLGPGHIVLYGDPATLPTGVQLPIFSPYVVAQWLDGSRCHFVGR